MKSVWRFERIVNDGEICEIDGINIWEFKWKETGEKINVKDPLYGRFYSFDVYKIQNDKAEVLFVAGEFSNCVWGIYLKEDNL